MLAFDSAMLKSGPHGPGKLDWLRQLFSFAELDEHFEMAACWADEAGCVRSDLADETCVQELIDTLALRRLEIRRLRIALGTYLCQQDNDERGASLASTAPSDTEVAELSHEPAASSFVEAGCDVDGTQGYVEVEHIEERSLAEANSAATTEYDSVSGIVSKKAKARARKQKRDAGKAAQAMPAAVETPIVRPGVSQNVWSETESDDGSKIWATRVVPYKRIGQIIGKAGSKIYEIEASCRVAVRINGRDVTVSGTPERVKSAMDYIDWIVNQDDWSKPGMSSAQEALRRGILLDQTWARGEMERRPGLGR